MGGFFVYFKLKPEKQYAFQRPPALMGEGEGHVIKCGDVMGDQPPVSPSPLVDASTSRPFS